MGVTESRLMPRRLPFTSKRKHPQAGAAILPPWCRALPHLCGHRAAAHSLHTDIHHPSWRTINTVFTPVVEDKVKKKKHSQITHTPSVLSLGSNEIPLKTGGPTTSPGSRGTHHPAFSFSFYFVFCYKGPSVVFLKKKIEKNLDLRVSVKTDEGRSGCAAELTPQKTARGSKNTQSKPNGGWNDGSHQRKGQFFLLYFCFSQSDDVLIGNNGTD